MSGVIQGIKQAVGSAWPQIVMAYGVDPGLLDGQQHPCPVCRAGVDRFRVMRDGRYFCQWCRSDTGGFGDWLDLIAGSQGIELRDLLRELGRRYDVQSDGKWDERREERNLAVGLWESARPAVGSAAEVYLRDRGLPTPPELRYHAAVYESGSGRRAPAMLAMLTDHQGGFVTVHRTYLEAHPSTVRKARISRPRKLMPGGGVSGAAVRLFDIPGAETICVAEGIETAIAARLVYRAIDMSSVPVYALVSTSGMKSFRPPEGVRRVLIRADHDASGAGQAAAWHLCAKLRGMGLDVPDPEWPAEPDTDYADVVLP